MANPPILQAGSTHPGGRSMVNRFTTPVDQKKLALLGVRPSEWLQLLTQYENLLTAFQLAEWDDLTARERVGKQTISVHTETTGGALRGSDPQAG